ncbi:unnamed protein product, partial [Phaeothamnion confervicola]
PGKGRAWVRRVKGNAWQSRPWVPGFGSVNLGIFTRTEYGDAAQQRAVAVSKAFDAAWQGATTVMEAVARLQARPLSARDRVRSEIEVPERARNLCRPVARPPAETAAAEALAARFPRTLWGDPVTAAALLEAQEANQERRDTYAAEFEEALAEGEPFAECVAILAG